MVNPLPGAGPPRQPDGTGSPRERKAGFPRTRGARRPLLVKSASRAPCPEPSRLSDAPLPQPGLAWLNRTGQDVGN